MRCQELRRAHNTQQKAPDLHVKGRKFIVVLPSPLVKSFFDPTIANIAKCLRGLKNSRSLRGLTHMFLVGGFSFRLLIQATACTELQCEGCVIVSTVRLDVAIVRGAMLFADNAEVFNTCKTRLTYGVRNSAIYNSRDPEHVRCRSANPILDEGKERILMLSSHIRIGQDISQDGVCPAQHFLPVRKN